MASTSTQTPGSGHGRKRWRLLIWGGAAVVLLVPAVAMRFTDEVDWSAADFVVMGAMLATACGLYELGARVSSAPVYRAAFAIAVLTGFMTVWVNLAVGMAGSERNPLNLLFAVVLLVAASGALLARFRARGMARAMAAAAAAQLLAVGAGLAVGVASGTDGTGGAELAREALLGAGFALPWLLSAALFRSAQARARLV